MNLANEIIITFSILFAIAIFKDESGSAWFIFVCGMGLLAMTQYGGERLRRFIRRWFFFENN